MEGLEGIKNGRDGNFPTSQLEILSYSLAPSDLVPYLLIFPSHRSSTKGSQSKPHSLWGNVESNNNLADHLNQPPVPWGNFLEYRNILLAPEASSHCIRELVCN